jgi:regulator of replication initiation timing
MGIPAEENVTRMPDREPIETKVARVEEAIHDMAGDVADLKMTVTEVFDKRLRMLEEVRVRALEDKALADRIREQEAGKRAKEAKSEAERHAELVAAATERGVSTRQFWIGMAITSCAAIFGALIEAHII